MRVHITMECTECHERSYLSNKNKRNNPDRLELKKYYLIHYLSLDFHADQYIHALSTLHQIDSLNNYR